MFIIQPLDEEQAVKLFDYGEQVGDPRCPECLPDFIDFVFQFACEHGFEFGIDEY